jgi:hypothetical protein
MAIPISLYWIIIFVLPIVIVIGAYRLICNYKRKLHKNWNDDNHLVKSILALSVVPIFVVIFFSMSTLPTLVVLNLDGGFNKYRVCGSYDGFKLRSKQTYILNKSSESCVYLSCFYGRAYSSSLYNYPDKVVTIYPNECIVADDGVHDVFVKPPQHITYESRSHNFPKEKYVGFVLNVSQYQEYISE